MTNDKKIGGIKSTDKTSKVHETENVGSVDSVKAASAVGKVGGVGGIKNRRPTQLMSFAERHQIFQMINEEADKLFANASEGTKKVMSEAVKMAIDAGLVDEEKK